MLELEDVYAKLKGWTIFAYAAVASLPYNSASSAFAASSAASLSVSTSTGTGAPSLPGSVFENASISALMSSSGVGSYSFLASASMASVTALTF